MNGQHQGLQLGDTSATMMSTSGGGEVGGEETTDNGNNTSSAGNKATGGGGGGGFEREAMASLPAADLPNVSKSANESAAAGVAAKGAGGDGNNRKGRGDGRTLKNTATRLATVISETSMAARAFSSKPSKAAKLETRILRNPVLYTEEPPFELPWLLKHGKAERLKLLEESLGGTPSRSATRRADPSSAKTTSSKHAGGKSNNSGGKGGQRQDADPPTTAGAEQQQHQQQGVRGDGASGIKEVTAAAERAVLDEEGAFEVLTVPDDKWISPDLPPEAGKQHQQDNHHAAAGRGGILGGASGGGFGSVGMSRPSYASGKPIGSTVAGTPQQLAGLTHKVPQRRAG
ncbi:unnamed protein product [Ectocarpus sp. 12 AP-2014]